jgi:PAS domain S-box-containing protein
MWGGAFCALTEVVLLNSFLTRPQQQFSIGNAPQGLRLIAFVTITLALGWAIQRLARERAELSIQKLQQRLMQANLERQLAEERARASEALRDREAMLQIALKANGMALWVWDLKQDVLHWSEERYRMIGLEPGTIEPSAEAWLRAVHPDDAERVKKTLMVAREGGTDYHIQYRVVWPGGSVHWLESQGKCQRDGAGLVERIVGVVADVTQRKRSEDALMRAEKLAIAGRLAASIAHEINNPLEAVSNLLFLIGMADTADTAQEHARAAMDQLMRVSMITQQTLKFHRQTGMPKAVRLSEILESVLTLFRSKMADADITLDVRSEHEIDVLCMPSETQQIFANLVANAIDAMPRGGRLVIRLRTSRDWRDGKTQGMRVTFSIRVWEWIARRCGASSSRFLPPRRRPGPGWVCGWCRNWWRGTKGTYGCGADRARRAAGRRSPCFFPSGKRRKQMEKTPSGTGRPFPLCHRHRSEFRGAGSPRGYARGLGWESFCPCGAEKFL